MIDKLCETCGYQDFGLCEIWPQPKCRRILQYYSRSRLNVHSEKHHIFLKKSKIAIAQGAWKNPYISQATAKVIKVQPLRIDFTVYPKFTNQKNRDGRSPQLRLWIPWNLKLKLRINERPARQTGQSAQQSASHPRTCLATRVLPSSQEAKVHLPIAVRLCSAHTALRKSPRAVPIFSILTRLLFASIHLPGRSCICVESRLISLQLFRFTTLMTVRILPRLPA